MSKSTLFVSIDVEADGPCPGLNNMLSFGVACFDVDGRLLSTFERNVREQSDFKSDAATMMEFWAKNRSAWDRCHVDQVSPSNAMFAFADYLLVLKQTYSLRAVGWPMNYDWMWIHYYFHRYFGSNPLGFSATCIGSYAWGMSKAVGREGVDKFVEAFADPLFVHTHVALDDAVEQGFKFVNMWRANTKCESSGL